MDAVRSYLKWPIAVTIAGLVSATIYGHYATNTPMEHISFVLSALILAALEISLSFDNAIVNANRLELMDDVWRRRFLTWGILIAVFGMRIVFPLAVVAIAAWINPLEAIVLAISRPDDYANVIAEAQISICAFGGTFLILVALSFFLDEEKEVHWVENIETGMVTCSKIRGFDMLLVLCVVAGFALLQAEENTTRFVIGAIFGMLTFTAVNALAQILDQSASEMAKSGARAGLGGFLYLEIIDASFSFDGVIGAFALTTNLFLIAIGLGIGAMYVRALTIMIVDKQTLARFRYLEHGAFYSVLVLSLALLLQSVTHVPELVIGLIGVALIGLGYLSSVRVTVRTPVDTGDKTPG
ncbi:DUF475 domain-containing protein [Roseibium sp. HPY-6]|uniref:DUF475 domain-containing protein n=1 Tax=Roseibium sp. HPY-6 TaxID=3229852 RepID=UPI00338FB561